MRDDDDDLLGLVGDLGAAINASKDDSLDGDLRDMAGSAAEAGAEQLSDEHRQG
ncbi:hypothetical protein [Streptomyces sp. DASNCL29]|uniref:hypothetical protein n=1 Tax=Streptomyces sp. DASNCL29 TaxID=2583819 RepID=UPI00148649A2|nr:hypothetical protein [Streptomyces sp. DASNCL29]